MKSRLPLFFVLIIVVLIIFCLAHSRYTINMEYKALFINLPSIQLITLEGNSVDLRKQIGKSATVLIYFNSTCPICQSEAELVVKNFEADSNINFIWVSSEPSEVIRSFVATYDLGLLHDVTVASDTLYQVSSYFKFTSVPATVVYSKHGALIDFFKGAVSMQDLKRAIQKAHDSKP